MSTEFDPYVPTLTHPPSPGFTTGDIVTSHGAPTDDLGSDGNLGVDLDTGDLYRKVSGSWGLVSGGSGTPELYFTTGDPNGTVTATRPAIAYAADGSLWQKTNSGSNNTGWLPVLAP